jgi:hypothetical protein
MLTIADKIQERVLSHKDSVKAGLVKIVTDVHSKETARKLTLFSKEFMEELRWELAEEVGEFACQMASGEEGDITSCVPGESDTTSVFRKKYAVIFLALGMVAGVLLQKLVNYPHQANVIDTSNSGLEMEQVQLGIIKLI